VSVPEPDGELLVVGEAVALGVALALVNGVRESEPVAAALAPAVTAAVGD